MVAVAVDVVRANAVLVFLNVIGAYVVQANAFVVCRNVMDCDL